MQEIGKFICLTRPRETDYGRTQLITRSNFYDCNTTDAQEEETDPVFAVKEDLMGVSI